MTSAAIQPKPWKCERCGHTKGLVESDGVIQCFTIPACVERQVARATDARTANGEPRQAGEHVNVVGSAREHVLAEKRGRVLCGLFAYPDECFAPSGRAMCATCDKREKQVRRA